VLSRAERSPQELSSLGFFVLAPREQIARQVFSREMSVKSMEEKVAERASEYPPPRRDTKERWRQDWFLPTLSQMKVDCLCWEDIIDSIRDMDAEFGSELSNFYIECLRFNCLQEPDVTWVKGSVHRKMVARDSDHPAIACDLEFGDGHFGWWKPIRVRCPHVLCSESPKGQLSFFRLYDLTNQGVGNGG